MTLKSVVKNLKRKRKFSKAEAFRLATQKAALERGDIAAYYAAMPDPTSLFWQKYQKREEKKVLYAAFMDSLSWR